jgi:hypothetical protein
VQLATGDLNGDGRDELVIAPLSGGGPHIKIYSDLNRNNRVSDELTDQFFAYSPAFTGGVNLALGDLDNDGRDELVTAPNRGGGPHVKVFDDLNGNRNVSEHGVRSQFFAYNPKFNGGVFITVGAIPSAGDAGAEIITGAGQGGGPHVRIFTRVAGQMITFREFFAYNPKFTGGVRVAAADTDNNDGGMAEVVTSPGPGGGPHVRIFDGNALDDEFFLNGGRGTSGMFVTVGDGFVQTSAPNNVPEQFASYTFDTFVTSYAGSTPVLGPNTFFFPESGFSFRPFQGTFDVAPTRSFTTNNFVNPRDIRFVVPNTIIFATNADAYFGVPPLDIAFVELDNQTSRLTLTVDPVTASQVPNNQFLAGPFGQLFNIRAGAMVIDFLSGGQIISGSFRFDGQAVSGLGTARIIGNFSGVRQF